MWVYIYIYTCVCVCMVLTYNSSLYGCFSLWCYVYLLHMRVFVCVCAYGLAMVVLSGHVLGCVGSISFSSFGTVVISKKINEAGLV